MRLAPGEPGAAPVLVHGARRDAPMAGRWLAAIAALAIAAVGIALVSQHVYDLQPCPWCVLQRLVFTLIGLVALIGWVWRRSGARRVAASVVVLLALCGAMAALWQHFRAAASAACNLTFADKLISGLQLDRLLPEVFEPRASCADAAVNLLGVAYDFWSLALFVTLAAAGWRVAASGGLR